MTRASLEWVAETLSRMDHEVKEQRGILTQTRDSSRSNQQTLEQTVAPSIRRLDAELGAALKRMADLQSKVDKAEGALDATQFWGSLIASVITVTLGALGLLVMM